MNNFGDETCGSDLPSIYLNRDSVKKFNETFLSPYEIRV
jgi:hypothetical protein